MVFKKNTTVNLVIPQEPTTREQFAAEELQEYMKRIMGISFTKVQEPRVGEVTVILGGPARNAAAATVIDAEEFNGLLTGEEGVFIDICENTILIAGSDGYNDHERGTIYGVYEFLERYMGCSFASYCAPHVNAGEIIPRYDEFMLPNARYVKAGSDRPYRTALVEYGDSAGNPHHELNIPFCDWLLKNRYNRILTWSSVYEEYKKMGLLPELEKRGIRLTVGHHEATRLWLPFGGNEYFPEAYAKTHPEYYRLNADGTRFTPKNETDPFGQWVFCSRNQECIEEISKNIICWISDNPLVDVITLWPMDGIFEQCSCEKCAPYNKVENYVYFQNEVVRRVSAVHPHIKFEVLIYVDLWECPEGMKLSSNLIINEATWGEELRRCGKPDGSGIIGTYFDTNLLQWQKTGAQVVYYDYYMGVFGNRQRVIPMADEIQTLWQYFVEQNIAGAGTQIECFHIWNHLVNLYTFGRTSYDTSLSFEDNLAAICDLFGEGADYVAQAVRMMEETLDGQAPINLAGKYMIEHIDKAVVYDLFEKALAITIDKRCRNNIRLMRMAFRYSEIETADSTNVEGRVYERFQTYEDPTGELAYMATNFDSFYHNDPGYGIAFPVTNTDTKNFVPDHWYAFE